MDKIIIDENGFVEITSENSKSMDFDTFFTSLGKDDFIYIDKESYEMCILYDNKRYKIEYSEELKKQMDKGLNNSYKKTLDDRCKDDKMRSVVNKVRLSSKFPTLDDEIEVYKEYIIEQYKKTKANLGEIMVTGAVLSLVGVASGFGFSHLVSNGVETLPQFFGILGTGSVCSISGYGVVCGIIPELFKGIRDHNIYKEISKNLDNYIKKRKNKDTKNLNRSEYKNPMLEQFYLLAMDTSRIAPEKKEEYISRITELLENFKKEVNLLLKEDHINQGELSTSSKYNELVVKYISEVGSIQLELNKESASYEKHIDFNDECDKLIRDIQGISEEKTMITH